MLSRQEIYDKVKQLLLAQNRRAIDGYDSMTCVLQNKQGDKCAIGHLLNNEQIKLLSEDTCYIPNVIPYFSASDKENVSDENNIPYNYEYQTHFMGIMEENGIDAWEHRYFLNDLQNLHDHTDPEHWEKGFHLLAKKYNLTP